MDRISQKPRKLLGGSLVNMRAVALVLLMGCAPQVREAKAIQPNPARALRSADVLPLSETLHVFTRDNSLPRSWQLRSSVQFAVVTRDMIRVHLSIARHDEREADTRSWKVWLEDDGGRRLLPASREMAKMDRLLIAWLRSWDDVLQRFHWTRVFPGWDAYHGRADYVFRAPALMTRDRKSLTLVAERAGYQMRFTYNFDQGELVELKHYGRSRVDEEMRYASAPADAEVAQTWYEGEDP